MLAVELCLFRGVSRLPSSFTTLLISGGYAHGEELRRMWSSCSRWITGGGVSGGGEGAGTGF
jgi:hypothetical protein